MSPNVVTGTWGTPKRMVFLSFPGPMTARGREALVCGEGSLRVTGTQRDQPNWPHTVSLPMGLWPKRHRVDRVKGG